MIRYRDYRKDQATRDKYADVELHSSDFIYPYFVVEGSGVVRNFEYAGHLPFFYRHAGRRCERGL